MINYIIQVLLFQTVFIAVYDLVLKKETFFQWNRAYLIITSVLAYVIPFIRFTGVSENIPQEYRIMLPEVILSPETFIEKQVESSDILFSGIQWIFIIGVMIASILFATKLFQIFKLIRQNIKEKNKDYHLVLLPTQNTAFSFFNYIFLGNTIQQKEEIIKHELIHVKQNHSIDLLFFEIQKIVFWFNPFSYLYQSRISEIHEFIADSKSVSRKEKSTFFNSLLAEAFQVDKITFVNSFNNQSLIKKRIIMFKKDKSRKVLKLKYLLMIPVLLGMLIYSSCETNSVKEDKKLKIENTEKANNDIVEISSVNQVPVFPGCEDATNKKDCFTEKIAEFIKKNYNWDLNKNLGIEAGEKPVYVQFVIDKTGNISDVKARGPNVDLEKEAVRVIRSLPQMQPGEENGKKVSVKYTLPIRLAIK